MEKRVQLGVEIRDDLKRRVDADQRTNRDAVEAALITEYRGKMDGGWERELREIQARKNLVLEEIREREMELAELEDREEDIKEQMQFEADAEQRVIEEAVEVFGPAHLQEVNPAIENWAEKADLPPEEFLQRLRDHFDNDE